MLKKPKGVIPSSSITLLAVALEPRLGKQYPNCHMDSSSCPLCVFNETPLHFF